MLRDEEAWQEARAAGIAARPLGLCNLKGFTRLHRVYEVMG